MRWRIRPNSCSSSSYLSETYFPNTSSYIYCPDNGEHYYPIALYVRIVSNVRETALFVSLALIVFFDGMFSSGRTVSKKPDRCRAPKSKRGRYF